MIKFFLMLKNVNNNIPFFIVMLSATFVCLKMTPGGEPVSIVIFFKAIFRCILAAYVSYNIYRLLYERKLLVTEPVALFLLLIIISTLSIVYSVDRFNSIVALLEFVTSAGAAYFLAANSDPRTNILLRASSSMSIIIGLILFCFYFISPQDIFVSMNGSHEVKSFFGLGGNIIHVHSLAMVYLALLTCLLWKSGNSLVSYVYILISTLVILATLSRTGFIILFIVGLIWLIFKKRSPFQNMVVYLIVTIFTLIALYFYSDQLIDAFMRGSSTKDVLSGSHRTFIFADGINNFYHSPLLGYGFDNLSFNGDYLIVDNAYTRSSLHNQFLYVLVSTGAIGLIIFLLFLLSIFIKSVVVVRTHRMRNASYFIVLLLFSLTQDTIMNDSTPLQFLTFILLGCTKSQGQKYAG